MTSKPDAPKVQYHHGRSLLFGPSVRKISVDALFETGRTTEQAAALWTAATTDTGPVGDRARALIKVVTDIEITIEGGGRH
jgi:hypothetical protein